MSTLANAALKLKRRAGTKLPHLWLMTDEQRMTDPAAAVRTLPRGSAVILRHYGDKHREALAVRLAQLCRARHLQLFVAGDWRLAARVNAAGLHLPDYMVRGGFTSGARLWRRTRNRLLTVAAHGAAGLRRARTLHASAAVLAPVFATASHPGRPPLGARRFGLLARSAKVPVIALGGITARTIAALQTSGSAGVAGIGFAKKKGN
jgi:thiamine-phosphate pyrophosphorylase